MKLEEITQIIESARARGEKPNLIGCDLSGLDLSNVDLSEALFQENPLAGIYQPGSKLVPLPARIRAKYNSKTIFPDGFDRYDEMEKID